VLEEGNEVEENGDIAQGKLGRVRQDRRPVTTCGSVYKELDQRKNGTREVQRELEDAESPCRFAPDVEPYLWRVLDDGEEGLDVANEIDL